MSSQPPSPQPETPLPGAAQADLLKALADPLRIRMLHLMSAANSALCICEFVDALETPQYQISRHMAVLKNAGLVASQREGVWVYYALQLSCSFSKEFWNGLIDTLAQDPLLQQDYASLQSRLNQRSGGRCVIGLKS